jgi:hypothetical protein
MSVVLEGDTVRLVGDCGVEEAEVLLALLTPDCRRFVDLSAALSVHTSVFQVLLLLKPPLSAQHPDPFFDKWLAPLLFPASKAGRSPGHS